MVSQGPGDDNDDEGKGQEKMHRRIDILEEHGITDNKVIAEVLDISESNVEHHLLHSEKSQVWEDKNTATWEFPATFFISDIDSAECTIKVERTGAGLGGMGFADVGEAKYKVKELLQRPKYTETKDLTLAKWGDKQSCDSPTVKLF